MNLLRISKSIDIQGILRLGKVRKNPAIPDQ